MAFHIMKDTDFQKDLSVRYYEYATVESERKTGLKKFFGSKVGTVGVALPEGSVYPLFRVIVPEWKGGQGNEWESLQQCYRQVLQMAADRRCEAISIPLLEAENPDFPASIDYKIAVDTIREFLEEHTLDVYLMVCRQNAVPASKLYRDVERFLSQHYTEWKLRWNSKPFADEKERFDTIVPGSSLPAEIKEEKAAPKIDDSLDEAIREWAAALDSASEAPYGQSSVQQECFPSAIPPAPCAILPEEEYDDDAYEEIRPKARPADPKKAASRMPAPKRARTVDRSTGRLPVIPMDLDAGFSETLLKLIDRTGKKDSEIYNKANVSRQHFSKIRNNPDYKPTKPTAIAFAIALELDMEETEDLIGRAGYRLTRSSKFDVIIMYFIQNRNYNMFDINQTLYEFDQNLLGA